MTRVHARPFAEVNRRRLAHRALVGLTEIVVFGAMVAVIFMWMFLLAPAPVTAP